MRYFNTYKSAPDWRGHRVYVYKNWIDGRRFCFASYPDIFVSYHWKVIDNELMLHESRHLQQQKLFGGVLFLLTYALSFVILLPFKRFSWFDAYYAIPFEKDARSYANKKIKETE